jgi:protein-tyrosine-phosphatase
MVGIEKSVKKIKRPKVINLNFICTGNTCRSYIAEAFAIHLLKTIYFKKKPELKDIISIGSAGTNVLSTDVPPNTYRVLDLFEVPKIYFKPKALDVKTIINSDALITMATTQKRNILSGFAVADPKKIFNLLELSNIVLYLQSEDIFKRDFLGRNTNKETAGTRTKNLMTEILKAPKIETKSGFHAKIFHRILVLKNTASLQLVKPPIIYIEDPYGRSVDNYIQVAKTIKESIIIIFDYLFG